MNGTEPTSMTLGRAALSLAKMVPKMTMKNSGNRMVKNRLTLSR